MYFCWHPNTNLHRICSSCINIFFIVPFPHTWFSLLFVFFVQIWISSPLLISFNQTLFYSLIYILPCRRSGSVRQCLRVPRRGGLGAACRPRLSTLSQRMLCYQMSLSLSFTLPKTNGHFAYQRAHTQMVVKTLFVFVVTSPLFSQHFFVFPPLVVSKCTEKREHDGGSMVWTHTDTKIIYISLVYITAAHERDWFPMESSMSILFWSLSTSKQI